MTSRYINVTPLPDALRSWSGKPLDAIPADTAPPGYLPGCDGENRLLADVFARLWLDELHEAAAAEIGVRFIDEAARRTA